MIRLAIVGCGTVVEVFHLPALSRVEGMELAALVDLDTGRARGLADRVGAAHVQVAAHVRDLAGSVDAAIVALPNYLHAETCVALLESGCDVLVEKPMATSVAECDRMIAAARASGRVLGAAMVRRFMPAYQIVGDLALGGMFGPLQRVHVREGVAYNWPAATGFFVKRGEAGGGVLVDFGSHLFDALSWWLGPLTVRAYEDDAYGGVEAECAVHLVDGRGVPIEVELTRLRQVACTARLEWERAKVEIDLRSGAATWTISGSGRAIHGQAGVDAAGRWTPGDDPFTLQLRAFAADVRSRAGLLPTATVGREIARLFEDCAALKRPLDGPASPALDPVVVPGQGPGRGRVR